MPMTVVTCVCVWHKNVPCTCTRGPTWGDEGECLWWETSDANKTKSNNEGRESCEILFPRTLYLLLSFSRWYQKAYWQHWIVFTMTLCDQFACMLSIRLCIWGASNNHQKQGNHCNHNLQPLSTKFGKKPKRRFLCIQLLYLSRRLGWGRPAGGFLGTSGSQCHIFALSHFYLIFTCID